MRLLILSDIHGNLAALTAVLASAQPLRFDQVVILGDFIDYGPHSNEVIESIKALTVPVTAIFGNHEDAVITGNDGRFSSDRGRESAAFCRSQLTEASRRFLSGLVKTGITTCNFDGLHALLLHGSFGDPLWGTLSPGDAPESYLPYQNHSLILSGHSHRPHWFERYYQSDHHPETRNNTKTVFLNPGSVGQPRNHNPAAQYALYDTDTSSVTFMAIPYDIAKEQAAFPPAIPAFYRERLTRGI